MNIVSTINSAVTTAAVQGSDVSLNTGNLTSIISEQDLIIEYVDLLYQLMGVDITYEKFKNLSSAEKIQLIRDIKLKKLIQE